jgi:hypothetical protein
VFLPGSNALVSHDAVVAAGNPGLGKLDSKGLCGAHPAGE